MEAVKAHIVTEYIEQDALKLINPVYDKRRLYIMTESQEMEYQRPKKVCTKDHM
ncbi:MAG: hypothetical protein HXS52_12020 [Theionarchaea archaeon]|nr:hypothetical protein [Theionarchaea archaeon]